MKTRHSLKSVIFFIILCISLVLTNSCDTLEPSAGPGELIYILNGDFEDHAPFSIQPEYWSPAYLLETEQYVLFGRDKNVSHEGSCSAYIKILENHPKDRLIYYNFCQSAQGFSKNQNFKLSGWIRSPRMNNQISILVVCSSNTEMINVFTAQEPDPQIIENDFHYVSCEFNVKDEVNNVIIRAGLTTPYNIGNAVWFDDIKIEKIIEEE